MQRVVCNRLGPVDEDGVLTIEDGDDPTPRPDQVVLEVGAAGVNYVDGLFVGGTYQIKPPVPFTPGGEVAGTVVALGEEVEGWAVGDRAVASTGLGGFASHVAVGALGLLRVPDGVDLGIAATCLQSYATALFALVHRTHLAEGEQVLVLGAGGGVGLAACDVVRSLGGRAIAVASTPSKRAAATAAGAATAIGTDGDLKTAAREAGGGSVDIVIDPVGGDRAEPALRALGIGGRFCVIGFAGGGIPKIPLNLVLLSNRTVVGVDWGAWSMRDPAGNRALLEEILAGVASGRFHPTPPEVRPLTEAGAALADQLAGRVVGKLALTP